MKAILEMPKQEGEKNHTVRLNKSPSAVPRGTFSIQHSDKKRCVKRRAKNIFVHLGANMERINNTLITVAHVYEMQ